MDYNDSKWSQSTLEEIWSDVEPILKEEEQMYNYRLKDRNELEPEEYGKGITQKSLERALVDLRKIKAQEGEIDTKTEPGEGNHPREVWIYTGDTE